MKKIILTAVVSMMLGSSVTALASTDLVGTEIKAVFAKFNLEINGQTKEFETLPLVYNGTSYLPVRDIANLIGYDVTYKADSRTIALNNVTSATYKLEILPPAPTPTATPNTTPTTSPAPKPTATPTSSPDPTTSEGTVFFVAPNTVLNMDEWFSVKELSKEQLLQMDRDERFILKTSVATLSFPWGINTKPSEIPLLITSADGSVLLIYKNEPYLKKEGLKILGINK